MGQTKFKYLNRVGYSIYWNNSWESLNNFRKSFVKYFFLDLFLNKIFDDSFFVQDYFYLKNKYSNKNNFINNNIFFLKKLFVFKKKFKNLKIFNSKIWILSYQNFIIINVYVYITKKNVNNINNEKKKKIILKKIKYNNYLNKFNFL